MTVLSTYPFVKRTFLEGAAPGAPPPAGQVYEYAKADGLLYSMDDAGVETVVSGGGGGGGAVATDAIWDAKGDLAVGTGANTAAKLTVGANGTVPVADSVEATGIKWAANIAGSATGSDSTAAAALAAHEADTTSIHGIANTANLLVSGGALGTPSSGVGTNLTGTAAGLTAGNVTTNANLTGDVTSVGNAATIPNDTVTYAKIQNVSATDKVLGRSTAGAGDVEEIAATSFGRGVLAAASNAAIVDLIGGAASIGTGGLVRELDTIISPAQITADTDDWNPTGLSTARIIRCDFDANLRYLSSIVFQAGKYLELFNTSANTAIIKDKIAALGTAANRFECGGQDLPFFPGDAMQIFGDATTGCWRVVAPMAKVIPTGAFGGHNSVVVGASYGTLLLTFVTGTGATVAQQAATANFPFSMFSHSTGSTNAGYALVYNGSTTLSFLLGNSNYWSFESLIRIPTASNGTDTFFVRVGFAAVPSTVIDPTDGVFLRYTDAVNSGNWVGVIRNNGSETTVNTSTPPPFSATVPFTVRVVVTPSRVEWYQNKVLIGSSTTMTNLPTTRTVGWMVHFGKTVGTAALTMQSSRYRVLQYIGVP